MKNTRLNYVVVGSFVVGMVVALVVTVAMLAGRTGATDTYYTTYDNVAGIKFGTQVLYEGFPIGQVEAITAERDGARVRFKVEMSVQEGWSIPNDSVAKVNASGLLAAISINIHAGVSNEAYEPGAKIRGAELTNVMAAFENVAGQIGDMSENDIRPLLANLNKYIASLGGTLEKTAPELLQNLTALSRDLADKGPRMITNMDILMADMAAKGPDITSNFLEASQNINEVSASLLDTKNRVDAMLVKMEALAGTVDEMVVRNRDTVDESLANIRHTLQAVARHIDAVTYNLEGSSRNLHEFSRQIRQNPGVLLSGQKTADDAATPPAK